MAAKITIASLSRGITTEAHAYAYLETLRWGDSPTCAHCDSTNVYLIGCANGVSRATRTGTMSERRVWKCRTCKRQFSVLTGAIMHGTKMPVRNWLLVIFEMTASKNGTAAREIERKYGICPRSAWFMLHRIRAAMAGDGLLAPMTGTIVADETWIGGSDKNKHARRRNQPVRVVPGQPDRDPGKTPILSIICADTGEVRSAVVGDVSGASLGKVIADRVNMSASVLWTDQSASYNTLGQQLIDHQSVNHSIGQYVRYTSTGAVSSNKAENFFSQLKRSIDGTHHHVTRGHLPRYLGEFDFR